MAYFSLLPIIQQQQNIGQKVFRMISSAQNLKHKIQKLNILGQKEIIQPVPLVLDCLGDVVPIYCQIRMFKFISSDAVFK